LLEPPCHGLCAQGFEADALGPKRFGEAFGAAQTETSAGLAIHNEAATVKAPSAGHGRAGELLIGISAWLEGDIGATVGEDDDEGRQSRISSACALGQIEGAQQSRGQRRPPSGGQFGQMTVGAFHR